MKQLALFAVLITLAGGTAFAQQDMGNSSTTGATYTTGIVESIDGSQLTLRDESKQVLTILIVKGTVGAKNHPVGSRVRVNFHNDETGQTIADEIQGAPGKIQGAPGEIQASEGEVQQETVATAPPTAGTGTPNVQGPRPAPAPVYTETPDTETASNLPRTASPLAAIGLLGLMSLSGALVIRFIR